MATGSLAEARERYRSLAKLGSGGMADVYLGVQLGVEDFKRLVVIKRIRVGDADGLRMLTDEARLVASLNHPHIVKIFELSTLGDDLCITMEYVDGESLAHLQALAARDRVAVPLPVVCKWMIEACEALHYAHHARSPDGTPLRIIHRDIGPQNLIVDRNGYLKIIDFGIAKSTAQTELTSPGMFKGKLPYVAPDIFSHTKLDGRIDLYALGLVFYEMVTLKAAFRFGSDVSVAEVMRSKTRGPLPAPSTVGKDIHPVLDALLLKATHPERDERFRTGGEFAQAIREAAPLVGGIASTSAVGDWFVERFADRVAQRRQFERLAMAKANEQPRDTPPPLAGGDRPRLETAKTINFAGIGSLEEEVSTTGSATMSRRANPYALALLIFALFLGAALVVRLVLWPPETQAPIAKGRVSMMFDNLFVSSDPPGAEVFINGEQMGNTGSAGLNLRVDAGQEHDLTLRLAGHDDYSVKLKGERYGQRQIRAPLVRSTGGGLEVSKASRDADTEKKNLRRRRRRPPTVRRRRPPPRARAAESTRVNGKGGVKVGAAANPKWGEKLPVVLASANARDNVARLRPARNNAAANLPLPPPPPMIPPQRPEGPVPQSTNEIMARRIAGAIPTYPRSARERSIESTVVVRVVIGENGSIRDTQAISGEKELRAAVRQALRNWRFRPHLVAGKPAETTGTLKFVFELQD